MSEGRWQEMGKHVLINSKTSLRMALGSMIQNLGTLENIPLRVEGMEFDVMFRVNKNGTWAQSQ